MKKMFTVGASTPATRMREQSIALASSVAVIIDSGASEHVVGDSELLTEMNMVPNIHADLSDCQQAVVTQKERWSLLTGSVYVTSTLVYYIPGMNINIIS